MILSHLDWILGRLTLRCYFITIIFILSVMKSSFLEVCAPSVILGAIEYVCVFFAILADLVVGVKKSCAAGAMCTSWGLRRTVDKISRYYLALISLSVVDVMLVSAGVVLRDTGGISVPIFPILTTFGAVGLALIEVKSIFERAEQKGDLSQAIHLVSDLLTRLGRKG